MEVDNLQYFYVTSDSKRAKEKNTFVTNLSKNNAQLAINDAIKAAGAVATVKDPAMVLLDDVNTTYRINNHIWFTPNGNSGVTLEGGTAPKYPCSHVILCGRPGVTIKLATGLNLDYWGSKTNSVDRLGLIYMYGASHVTVCNLTIDGSYTDYKGKTTVKLGQSKGDLIVALKGSNNLKFYNLTLINGFDDGFYLNGVSDVYCSDIVNKAGGHDGWNCYNCKRVTVEYSICGMNTNCGFRWSGPSDTALVRFSEFYTMAGGASAFELQNTGKNITIKNCYIHDITPTKYGGIGYPGQSPTGSGHVYESNLITNCNGFGISSNIPSTAVVKNNCLVNASLAKRGSQSGNITSVSGKKVTKNGSNGSINVNWVIDKKLYGIPKRTSSKYSPAYPGTSGSTPTPPKEDPPKSDGGSTVAKNVTITSTWTLNSNGTLTQWLSADEAKKLGNAIKLSGTGNQVRFSSVIKLDDAGKITQEITAANATSLRKILK